MTNLELGLLCEKLNAKIDEVVGVVQRVSQKQVKNDEALVKMRDEIDKLKGVVNALKTASNNLMSQVASSVVKY